MIHCWHDLHQGIRGTDNTSITQVSAGNIAQLIKVPCPFNSDTVSQNVEARMFASPKKNKQWTITCPEHRAEACSQFTKDELVMLRGAIIDVNLEQLIKTIIISDTTADCNLPLCQSRPGALCCCTRDCYCVE